ncbi:MAG: ATP-binding protein [Oceanisphaera sp.]
MHKFYNRKQQLSKLRQISSQITNTKGRLSVVVGRRRVGKTRLLNEAFNGTGNAESIYLYLFISRKSEAALVDEFRSIIAERLGTKFFQPQSLRDIFEYLFDYATVKPLTLVVDEFQDIEKVNSSLFSDLQNLWDSYKNTTMLHLVCCGSLYSLMTNIFKGSKQPLLNRDDYFFKIQPLAPSFIKEVLYDSHRYSAENMLTWWCLSGGIPKYLEWLINADDSVFDELISDTSPLIKEGTHRLVEDFGAEHRVYFDVLGAIANGHTTRARIESYLNAGVGPALEKLDTDFAIIGKMRPITSKETSRDVRYRIVDPFLNFWFHFIYSNRSAVEMENYTYLKNIIERDFNVFSGKQLEALFEAVLIESKQFNRIGSYWDTKGENEVDIVAIDDINKRILIVEVKRQAKRYQHNQLLIKSAHVLDKLKLKNYQTELRCFSLDTLEEVMIEFSKSE